MRTTRRKPGEVQTRRIANASKPKQKKPAFVLGSRITTQDMTDNKAQDSPLRARQQGHDGLCIQETAEYGMGYCHCMRPCCWSSQGRTSDGYPRGACICKHCPCRQDTQQALRNWRELYRQMQGRRQ